MTELNVRAYWDDRARHSDGAATATTNDVYLRVLEARTLIDTLNKLGLSQDVTGLDAGCGDGRTAIAIVDRFPRIQMTGIDFSQAMIEVANARRDQQPSDLQKNLRFVVGDIRKLSHDIVDSAFDFVTTDRCLINLILPDEKKRAIEEIASTLKPGGYFLPIENFVEGHNAMNMERRAVGLSEIQMRWHNKFFTNLEFRSLIENHFELVEERRFASAYYYATRVIYAKMCQDRNEEPDYQHDIHRFAIDLNSYGDFSPMKLIILRRRS